MANEGTFGSLGGMGAGALAGFALGGPFGAGIGAGLGGSAGGLIGGLFGSKPKTPDISGELARISGLFAQLRAQQEVNINRQAGQGRRAAASNLAARGIYRAPVSENVFGQLESDRLNSIATANAQLAGQEAATRSRLLESLLGIQIGADQRAAQVDAARTGQLTGLSSSILMALLQRGAGAPSFSSPKMTALPASNNFGYIV